MSTDPQSTLLESAPAPAPSGSTAPAAADDGAGWVSARPPRLAEIARRLFSFPRMLRDNWDLVSTSVRRDLAARFQGTVLGVAWPFLQPLLLFGVYYFIFTQLLQQRMPGLAEDQKAGMGVYMFVGMVAWSALGETLGRGTGVIVDNGNLIKKLAFPSELLPLNVVLSTLTMMLCGMTVFVLAACVSPLWKAPTAALLWLPVILLLQAFFTYGLVLFTSTLQVFLRDTQQIIGMAVTVWMFLTPVFWAPEAMKAESVAVHLPLITSNPTYHLLRAWRGALMGDVYVPPSEYVSGGYAASVAAIPHHLGVFALWALGVYVLGYAFFVLSQRRFADEV